MSSTSAREIFGEPTPLAMIGLAVGCAALTPIAFGHALTPAGFRTAAYFCLLFGFGGQLLAGLMAFANKNTAGGTLLTAFSFNWLMNYLVLENASRGVAMDHTIMLSIDVTFLVVFLVMTYAFGFVSSLLLVFMIDIDLLYVCKVLKALAGPQGAVLNLPIALATVLLGVLALWVAFAILLNPLAGRRVLPFPGPAFKPAAPSASSASSASSEQA